MVKFNFRWDTSIPIPIQGLTCLKLPVKPNYVRWWREREIRIVSIVEKQQFSCVQTTN